jgi:GNAT superfamily N-acetyltransferase
MALQLRHYRDEDDYWRARAFLRRLPRPDGAPGGNWHVALFDYWRWHWLENVVERDPRELCIWEDGAGEMAAILNQGDPGVCHLHIQPDVKTPDLLSEVVATAEREYSTPSRSGGRIVCVWSMEDDEGLIRVFRGRGYETFESEHAVEHHGRRPLDTPIHDVAVPEGFHVRSMGDVGEHGRRSLASWRAFHPDEPDSGCDMTGAWYRNVQRAPLYRRDLDVVAVAPNGDIASFAVAYFDDAAREGVFVLDGTATAYQRLGLAKAVMTEALRRLQWLGATNAYVDWYESPAGALYESVGLHEERRGRCWMKRL